MTARRRDLSRGLAIYGVYGPSTVYPSHGSPLLVDSNTATLFIAAATAAHVEAVLAPWRRDVIIHYLGTTQQNAVDTLSTAPDIILPGGTMALLALVIEQWGPPP